MKNIFKSKILILFLCFFFISSIGAKKNNKDEIFLPLEEAILLALRDNPDIKKAKLQRVLDKYSLRIAQNEFELQYELGGKANSLFNRTVTDGSATVTRPSYSISPSVKWKSPIGTSVGIDMPQKFDHKGNHSVTSTLSITQPLLRGFGKDVNLIGLRSAYESEEMNRLNLRDSISATIINVVTSYRELIKEKYNIESVLKSQKDDKKQIRILEERIKLGKIAPVDILQPKATYERSKLNVEQRINAVDVNKQELLAKIGLDPNMKFTVPKDVFIGKTSIPDVNKIIEVAKKNNTTYLRALLSVKQAERSLMKAKNDVLWSVNLTISGGLGGGNAYNSVNGRNHSEKVELGVTIPMNKINTDQTIAVAQINLENARNSFKQSERDLITKVKNEVRNIESQIQQIKLAENYVKFTKRSYANEQKKQEVGKASAFNVVQAQDNLNSAKEQLIGAKIAYLNSVDNLNHFLGKALEQWNIELEY